MSESGRSLMARHREAMRLCEDAMMVRSRDASAWRDLLTKAFDMERACAIEADKEPTKSILLQSAANMARDLGREAEAKQLEGWMSPEWENV